MIKLLYLAIFMFTFIPLSSASEKSWQDEWIAGSTLIYNFESVKKIPYVGARVFVRSGGCTEKKSFELKISSVSFEKNVQSVYRDYSSTELPIIELTLIKKEVDECRAFIEIIPIDFSAEEIAAAVNTYLGGKRSITRDDVKLIRWTNLNMPTLLQDFNYGVKMPLEKSTQ